MKYRIGDVSRVLNISPETLRFFEAKGIVSPLHDPKSSYRYFDSLDVNKMVAYLGYRRMGFSLDESLGLVSKCKESDLKRSLEGRLRELDRERERLEGARRGIERLHASLKRHEELDGKFELIETGPLLFFANQEELGFRLSERDLQDTRLWLEELPEAAPLCLVDTVVEPWKTLWGFAKPLDHEREPRHPEFTVIPAATCLHGFSLVPASDPSLASTRSDMEAWCNEHGRALGSVMHGSVLHELELGGETHWLYELFAPLSESP